jgi:hypothetical protein
LPSAGVLACAFAMQRIVAIAGCSGSWPGIGTQFVGIQTMSAPATAQLRNDSGNHAS